MIREIPLLPAAVCVCDQSGAIELYNRVMLFFDRAIYYAALGYETKG